MSHDVAPINSEFEHLLNVRTASLLRRWNLPLSEVGRYSAREFMQEANFGRHSLANLVEACLREGFDPPAGFDDWEAAREMAAKFRRSAVTCQPGVPADEITNFGPVGSEQIAQSYLRFENLKLEDITFAIEAMLDRLGNERLQTIAYHRLFLGEPMTLGELGAAYGVSRERIRQLEVKALRRLRAFGRRSEVVRACNEYLDQRCSNFDEAFSALHDHLRGISREDTALSMTTTLLGAFCDTKRFGVQPKKAQAEARALLHRVRSAEWRAERREARDRRKDAALASKRGEFFQHMMSAVRWPSSTPPNGPEAYPLTRTRARQIDFEDEMSIRGAFTSSREGYGEVHFESSLERNVLEILDASLEHVSWFAEQPLSIQYRDGAGRLRSYFPDILLSTSVPETVIVECKPVQRMVHLDTYVKARGATQFAAARGWGYVIVDDRGITLRRLIERVEQASERDLRAFMQQSGGSIPPSSFFEFCRARGLGGFDLTAAMLRLDLAYDTFRRLITSLPCGSWRALTSAG